jgi:aryl-alcohol dehydrogenase
MTEIRAAVATRPRESMRPIPVEIADPRADEVRVGLVATGVCHADVIARDQVYPVPLPAVLGHEGAGVVEAVGSAVVGLRPGDRVVLGFNYCNRCRFCRAGFPGNCVRTAEYNFGGLRPDGVSAITGPDGPIADWFFGQSSFATESNVPAHVAVKVETDLPLPLLAPLGCGVMTGAGAVWNVARPEPGTSFAVFGVGAVGVAALLAAKLSGCTSLIAVDVVPARLELARKLGATLTIDARAENVVSAIRDATGGGVDYAVDAAGATSAFDQMLSSLGTRGHGILVGAPTPGDLLPVDLNPSLGAGRRISFVLEGDSHPQIHIPRLVALMESGAFDYRAMIQYFPFEAIDAAVESAVTGAVVKPVLVFDSADQT